MFHATILLILVLSLAGAQVVHHSPVVHHGLGSSFQTRTYFGQSAGEVRHLNTAPKFYAVRKPVAYAALLPSHMFPRLSLLLLPLPPNMIRSQSYILLQLLLISPRLLLTSHLLLPTVLIPPILMTPRTPLSHLTTSISTTPTLSLT